MSTPQDRIIELLEEQVVKLKRQLYESKQITAAPKYIDIDRVCTYTSLSAITHRRAIQKEHLKCSKGIGKVLFKAEDIDRWIDFK